MTQKFDMFGHDFTFWNKAVQTNTTHFLRSGPTKRKGAHDMHLNIFLN